MSGDKLTLVTFAVALAAGAVMGAIAVNGFRARILWGLALVFGLATLVALRAETGSPAHVTLITIWTWSPFIGVAMALLVSGGRKPLEVKKTALPPPDPVLNPALTIDYFNKIVATGTEFEAKKKLSAFAGQRAKICGQVVNVRENVYPSGFTVEIQDMLKKYSTPYMNSADMLFRKEQADALEVIKPGDWIEFTGKVEHAGSQGWRMVECEFVGLSEAPKPPRARRAKA
jgi:hypothetical protein